VGIDDQGSVGLVDALDARSSFTALGRDVIVRLDVGTELVFAGLGTSPVASWADLVANPADQLLIA
jgi:hypothetical protein